MKKLVLAALVTAIGIGGSLSATATAASTQTVTVQAHGSVCEETGTITPQALTFKYGEYADVAFKNTEHLAIEIRNIPGGTFAVPGNSTVERSFPAKGSFVYAAWSAEGNCEKATAHINVNGGWWVRAWPWLAALLGSIIIVLIVRHLGHKQHRLPPHNG